ncbi:MAG: amino acid permease [Candidatus Brocadiaceae bacterium]
MALKRELGFLHVFSVASGAMISSGLFVLPALVFARVGPGAFLCYLLAAVLLLPTVLSKAELMTAMPKAGGTYFFIDRGLGPGFGTVGGVATWASLAFKSAFALLGIGALAAYIGGWEVSGWQVKAISCGFCVLFMLLNLSGVKQVGRAQVLLVAMLLVVLVSYFIGGLAHLEPARYRPLLRGRWQAVLAGTAMVFISFGGVTKIATLGEEVRRPRRNLLLGMFGATLVVSLLYVGVVIVTVGLLPSRAADWSFAPLSQAARTFWGAGGAVLLGVAAICAFLTTGNAGILAASRTIMAMGQDDLVPPGLARISPKRGSPVYAILFTGAFMMAIMLVLDLERFVKAASAMKILLFMFEMGALVLMRESRIPTYRPSWRCPLYPWVQVVGIFLYAFLLVELGTLPLAIAGVIIGGAVLWYFFYAKVHVLRESALVRLAVRVARADFKEHDLEAELSRVAREHDTVLQDRFDHLIQECTVLDLRGPTTREEAFRVIAENLARSMDLSAQEVYGRLLAREELSPTVIRPGLAIPHLILEGLESFEVILVRSRDGVVFAEDQPPVHTIFVLALPPEERNFYLRALVAIAEIAQEPEFDAKWMASGGPEALREVVLAAERRREHAWPAGPAKEMPPPDARE